MIEIAGAPGSDSNLRPPSFVVWMSALWSGSSPADAWMSESYPALSGGTTEVIEAFHIPVTHAIRGDAELDPGFDGGVG